MGKSATKDMTAGAPLKLILQFFVPMFFGMLFQQFYNMMDTIIVGKALGVNALAAVGATGSINFMIIGFCMGVCSGFAIPVAQRFGAGDYHALRKYVANSVWLSAIFAGVMTVVVCVLCRQILLWMRTPQDIFDGAYSYIFVIFVGIPVTYLYNLLSGIIRSLGDSRSPLIFLVFSSLLNIALDLLLILSFHLGVAGAAYATVISQAVSGVLCLFVIIRKFDILHLKRSDWVLDASYVRNLLIMGLPMGLQYSITAIGSVILQTAVNTLGSGAVAAMTAGSRISMFMVCPFDALGSTMATYGGQNVGAGKYDRLASGMKSAIILAAVYSAAILVVIIFLARPLIYLFIDPSDSANITQVVAQARQFLITNTCFYMLLSLVNIVRFLIQGMGFSGFAVFAGVFEMIARALIGLIFVPIFGFTAACFASPLAWLFADCFLLPAFFHCRKKLMRELANK